MLDQLPFGAVWVVDFEYTQPDGGLPDPLCVVGLELRTGARIAQWLTPGDGISCPYETGPSAVLIGHNFSAEALCHLVRGWCPPRYVLDTYVEIKAAFNGKPFSKAGLLDAAARLGIPTISSAAKAAGRAIAMQGRAFAEQHREELLYYCGTDVDTNADLLRALLPKIFARKMGLARSLMWGDYMVALAHVEYVGVPINTDLLTRLQTHWGAIRHRLIDRLDAGRTDCYVNYTFNRKRFSDLLDRLGLLDTWPRSETLGWPSTEEEIFRERAHGHPVLGPLFELHYTLQHLRKLTLHVGQDGRHRPVGELGTGRQKRSAGLYAFGTRTGRNAPKGFIFAPAVWVRFLIQPTKGWVVIYFDYKSQEVHIAARKSRDPNMIKAIESDDAYLWFAKERGMVPPDATKQSHKDFRDRILKPFNLSVNYGSGASGIANRLRVSIEYAQYVLLDGHKSLFSGYWQWVDDFLDTATANGIVHSALGWPLHVTADTKLRSLQNHPVQTAGADILRMALIGLVAQGVQVNATIHDAVLVECREEELGAHLELVARIMREAAKLVIGHEIPVDHHVVRYPDHYYDGRGAAMYAKINELLVEIEQDSRATAQPPVDTEAAEISAVRGEPPAHPPPLPTSHPTSLEPHTKNKKGKGRKGEEIYLPWAAPRWLQGISVSDM